MRTPGACNFADTPPFSNGGTYAGNQHIAAHTPHFLAHLPRGHTACFALIRVTAIRLLEPRVDFVAGLSLGEYTALVYAGAMTLEDALRVVKVSPETTSYSLPLSHGSLYT